MLLVSSGLRPGVPFNTLQWPLRLELSTPNVNAADVGSPAIDADLLEGGKCLSARH